MRAPIGDSKQCDARSPLGFLLVVPSEQRPNTGKGTQRSTARLMTGVGPRRGGYTAAVTSLGNGGGPHDA
jgi:hypothetical protein